MHNVNPPNKTAQHVQQKEEKNRNFFIPFSLLYGQEVSLRLFKNNEVRVFFHLSLERSFIYHITYLAIMSTICKCHLKLIYFFNLLICAVCMLVCYFRRVL